MKFYNRENELAELNKLYAQSDSQARMTVLTGRRRIGKTELALHFANDHPHIYLFVSRKSESLLCLEYLEEIKKKFNVPILGEIHRFKDIFALLFELASTQKFTLIIDEFQEFYRINPSVYSDVQRLWDLNKKNSRLNLIFIGSIYSLMFKIFQNSEEPLFGRADRIIVLKPFQIKTISNILQDNNNSDLAVLFNYYVFTGGMPKYIDLFLTELALSFDQMLEFLLYANSPFIAEGKNLLIEEFGKEYGIYFSILELISIGKTARTEMESFLEQDIGGYLDKLESNYALISKHRPINTKPNSRTQKYKIIDNFINFWFRYIYSNRSAIEAGNFEYIKNLVKNDYSNYCGRILEKYFLELLASTNLFNQIGSYWEKGNLNEIDIVAINDAEKKIVIAEVKLNMAKISLGLLQEKAKNLLRSYPNYKPEFIALSLDDSVKYLTPTRQTP